MFWMKRPVEIPVSGLSVIYGDVSLASPTRVSE
jgi:hypothetical protein